MHLPALVSVLALLAAPRQEARVAPEVSIALAAGGEVPVLVSLRPAPLESRRAAQEDVATGLLSAGRPLRNAGVVSGRIRASGLEALRRRADVSAVTLDRTVHPAGQPGPAQIGADRLTRLGLDGTGRSIAIVDSGIDALHPDFGAAPVPNRKVWGGWNIAGDNADVSDCSGHGTAVAGVAAGPEGVAPGAGIVALKVFGPDCRTASYSDVLRAVDWAISNRSRLRIDVLNLSLADDRADPGFCDAAEPASAEVFAAARAAGISVVAASGNGGRPDGLAWPACLSDVAAVGMVYSASIGPTSWTGDRPCQDRSTAADLVPCASNSSPTLGLLAPGVRWLTASADGGRHTSFSGTSAAAPAAAGALVLARQARVFADPAVALELLRGTGIPVVDDRNGRATPRIDVSAALDAADPVSGPCGASTGGITCQATVASLAGKISTLVVSATLRAKDEGELELSLTAPDGTRVRLSRGAGTGARAMGGVFGRTLESDEPLSRFSGRDASGTWTLRAEGAARVVSWAIQIETETPRASTPRPPAALLPAAVRSAGRFGAFFTTDLRLFNSDTTAAHDASLRFRTAPGDPERVVTFRIPPSGTRAVDDVLGNCFRAWGAGPIRIDAHASVLAFARTRTTAPGGGSFVLAEPVLGPDRAVGLRDEDALLLPLFREDGSRVNVGLVEMAGSTAEIEVRVRDGRGGTKGTLTRQIGADAFLQLNDVYGEVGQEPEAADRLELRVTQGKGRVLPFATALDADTNDGDFVTQAVAVRSLAIPVTDLPPGPARLDLKLSNPGNAPVRVRIAYAPAAGPSLLPVIVPIGRGESRVLADALGRLFSRDLSEGGVLRISPLDGDSVLAGTRTTRSGDAGRYGYGAHPLMAARGLPPGRKLAIPFVGGAHASRTELSLIESAGNDSHVRLTVLDAAGTLLRIVELELAAFDSIRWDDLFTALALPAVDDATAVLENVFGGAVGVQALRFDAVTGDPLAIPGVLIP